MSNKVPEIELQSVISNGAIISDVDYKNNRVYFRVNEHLFSTFGDKVYPEGSILFNHPFTNFLARRQNTPEGIEKEVLLNVSSE